MSTQEKILQKLKPYLLKGDSNAFHYERFLCFDKAAYLDAFVTDTPFFPFEVEIQTSSKCNLNCIWCVGEQIQTKNRVQNLPNVLNKSNIDKVVDGILETKKSPLPIDTVKFSGFIGDPLVQKDATLIAMKRLSSEGIRVGLFTNGVLLTEETWDIVSKSDYVHISLDAGPKSFYTLKENRPNSTYSQKSFFSIIDNIKGLDKHRKETGGKVKINIGYVIVEGNHEEIYEAANIVKDAGADMIRFKCDITNTYEKEKNWLNAVFSNIEKAKKDFHTPPSFSVHAIHSKEEMQKSKHTDWNCEKGCYFQYFMTTIGSDANMYLCDHNTMPGAIALGNTINTSFTEIWHSPRHKYLGSGVQYTCQSSVCPPFGNRINAFLRDIVELKKKYGNAAVLEALNTLRKE